MSEKPPKSTPKAERTPDRDLGAVPLDRITLGVNVRTPDPEGVKELAASIRVHGILEPVILADHGPHSLQGGAPGQPPYVLVAGFRRVAAAKSLGLKEVPARWRDMRESEVLEVQLVENLQREDLSELEEARGFERYLAEVTGSSQDALAARIGKAPSYVSNRLRLLKLDPGVQKNLEKGEISSSHAEVLASAPPVVQRALAKKTVDRDLSVRQLETEASWKIQRFKDAQREKAEFEKTLEKTSFPTCPFPELRGLNGRGKGETPYACGRRAKGVSHFGGEWLTDGLMGHDWSSKTGKIHEKPKRESREGPERKEIPAPSLPVVEALTSFDASPDAVAQYLLEGSWVTLGAVVYLERGKPEAVLRFRPGHALPKGVGPFAIGEPGEVLIESPVWPETHAPPKGKAVLIGAESWNQQRDPDRKRLADAKGALESWGKTLGNGRRARVGPKGKPGRKR